MFTSPVILFYSPTLSGFPGQHGQEASLLHPVQPVCVRGHREHLPAGDVGSAPAPDRPTGQPGGAPPALLRLHHPLDQTQTYLRHPHGK